MENVCNVTQLDTDVLLPPRKRLLAGLRKQSPEGSAMASPSLVAASCDVSFASPSSSSFPSEFEGRLKHLLSCHSNNRNLRPVELVEASKTAAITATKAAEAARTIADNKAAIAAKAVAAAKKALDLVASLSEEAAASKERNMKKNKSKKHLPVQLLYKKYQPIEHCGTDQELAQKLHRVMNSSPRISRHSPNLDSKGSKHKKPRSSSSIEIIAGEIDSEGSIQELSSSKKYKMGLKYDMSCQIDIEIGEALSSQSKENNSEDLSPTCKKRGRVKLKKLPLGICSSKHRTQPEEETRARGSPLTKPLFPVAPCNGVIPVEATSIWKCREFKAPVCIKQNKVVQS